jgi:hypothetical protein
MPACVHRANDSPCSLTCITDECKSLYPLGPPPRLILHGDPGKVTLQHACLGVYKIVPGAEKNGHPIWKHTLEDRCIISATVTDDDDKQVDGWVVQQATTLGYKDRRCMQLVGEQVPYHNVNTWTSWKGGRKGWKEEPTVHCRTSSHGWGVGQTNNRDNDLLKARYLKRTMAVGENK